MPSWMRNFARSLTFLSEIRTHVQLCLQGSVQLPFGNGKRHAALPALDKHFESLITGSQIRSGHAASSVHGALYLYGQTPLSGLSDQNLVLPSSYTHCTSPSLFRRTTNATSPMSRMVWTAPFTADCLSVRRSLCKHFADLQAVSFVFNACHKFHISFSFPGVIAVHALLDGFDRLLCNLYKKTAPEYITVFRDGRSIQISRGTTRIEKGCAFSTLCA